MKHKGGKFKICYINQTLSIVHKIPCIQVVHEHSYHSDLFFSLWFDWQNIIVQHGKILKLYCSSGNRPATHIVCLPRINDIMTPSSAKCIWIITWNLIPNRLYFKWLEIFFQTWLNNSEVFKVFLLHVADQKWVRRASLYYDLYPLFWMIYLCRSLLSLNQWKITVTRQKAVTCD